MREIERTGSRLVLRELPWLEGVVGVAFAAAGVTLLARGADGMVFLLLFTLVGGWLVADGARMVTCTFDRERGTTTREWRSLLRHRRREVPLESITAVRVSRNSASRRPTYRVELALRDGETVPLTPWASSGEQSKRELAASLREFLGLAPADDSSLSVEEAWSILRDTRPHRRPADV